MSTHEEGRFMLTRERINVIRTILEDWLPPVLRDSPILYPLLFWVYGPTLAREVIRFRSVAYSLEPEKIRSIYQSYPELMDQTDLNRECLDRILSSATQGRVLDVGCGRGLLVRRLSESTEREVFGVDFVVSDQLKKSSPRVTFVESSLEGRLPFEDASFDTVVCSHTLEHILNFDFALSELRRITRKRLILVVPRERESKYSFNLHVQFFPYVHSFLNRIQPKPGRFICEDLGRDLFYLENRES